LAALAFAAGRHGGGVAWLLAAPLVAAAFAYATLLARLCERERTATAAHDAMHEIVDNVRDVIFRTDPGGRWSALNLAWETMTGYTIAESLGTLTTTLLHPDDHPRAAELYPRLAAGEMDELTLEQHFNARGGKLRHIVVKVRRLVDAGGRFAGTVGTIADVTELVDRALTLARSEEDLRRFVHGAPVGLFRADLNGRLTYVTPNCMARLGRKPGELLGDGWLTTLADASLLGERPIWLDFKPGEVRRRRIPFTAADGAVAWIEVHTSAGFDEAGRVSEYYGAAFVAA
jgi:PAS domain S-box-containing protein